MKQMVKKIGATVLLLFLVVLAVAALGIIMFSFVLLLFAMLVGLLFSPIATLHKKYVGALTGVGDEVEEYIPFFAAFMLHGVLAIALPQLCECATLLTVVASMIMPIIVFFVAAFIIVAEKGGGRRLRTWIVHAKTPAAWYVAFTALPVGLLRSVVFAMWRLVATRPD
jgi:hypothetical protein